MADRLSAKRFLAVVRPSGSGKSSLVAIHDGPNRGYAPAFHKFSLFVHPLNEAASAWQKITEYSPNIPYGGDVATRGPGEALSV